MTPEGARLPTRLEVWPMWGLAGVSTEEAVRPPPPSPPACWAGLHTCKPPACITLSLPARPPPAGRAAGQAAPASTPPTQAIGRRGAVLHQRDHGRAQG